MPHAPTRVLGEPIFPLILAHNRLISRHSESTREERVDADLFITHAHPDGDVAATIQRSLERLWPDVVVLRTEAGDEEAFRKDPGYFLAMARRARCLLYVATPASIDRYPVDLELAHCADKPIVSLALGGTSLEDLCSKTDESLFLHLDRRGPGTGILGRISTARCGLAG